MKISVRVAPRQNKNAVVIHLPLNEKVLLLLLQLLLTVMLELNQRVGSINTQHICVHGRQVAKYAL